jgi:Cu/Ag efflux protein CusF/cytochrome c553
MPLTALVAICFAINSSLLVFASPSFASKHNIKTTPAAKVADSHHPKDWRFNMPKGDPAKGRAVFEKFECYYCHEVRGENFPLPTEYAPELSQMGPAHPVEFFAESIINPNAVVPKSYRQSDGTSPMTNFAPKMTVQELIDVSAYVASLKPRDDPKVVTAQGNVIAIVPENGEIVLAHEDIKGFMEAMTMGYKVSSPSLLKSVKAGDTVEFTIDTAKRVITKIGKAQSSVPRKER